MTQFPFLAGLLFVLLPLGLVAGLVSHALTGWSIRLAHRRNLVAGVNERSSHSTPTPRVGGIGLMGGVLVGLIALGAMILAPESMPGILRPGENAPLSISLWLGFLLPLILAFALGFWDDQSDPPAAAKLIGQVLIAALPPLLGLRFREFTLPGANVISLSIWLGVPLTAGWILLVMNAVNFMDGINGLAGTFGRRISLCFLVGAWGFAGWESLLPLCVALWGASAGFLRWNVPTARTFMGDCGSQPLGVLAALLAVHYTNLPTTFPLPFFAALAILSVFLFDVILTLVRRSLRGENIMKAHREHLYQRHLVAHGEDHARTLRFVDGHLLATGLAGGAMGLFFSTPEGATGQWLLLVFCGLALANYYRVVRRAERTPHS